MLSVCSNLFTGDVASKVSALSFFPSESRTFLKSLYIAHFNSQHRKDKDGSEMFDPTTLVLIGTGSSSLFVAFVEYAYERKKRMHSENHA